jgi:hypothetical protein
MAEELLCEAEIETGTAASWSDDTDEEDSDALNRRRRGRPAVLLTLNPAFGRIIAVSLRMNLIETLIADFSGSGLAQSRHALATRALDAGAWCDLVIGQIDAMLEATATPRHRLLGIGIALQGIVNADTGRQLWSPALSVTDVDLATPRRQAFGVEVVMVNDAVAVALSLAAAEPALAQGLSATIMVGHGVGMGVVVDGEARWGAGAGSEIGHVKLAPDGRNAAAANTAASRPTSPIMRSTATPAPFSICRRRRRSNRPRRRWPAARAGAGRRSPPRAPVRPGGPRARRGGRRDDIGIAPASCHPGGSRPAGL